jgi:hypothetical protein
MQNTEFLNVYAVALLETGDTQKAHAVLNKLVELLPDVGHEKYLCVRYLTTMLLAVRLKRSSSSPLPAERPFINVKHSRKSALFTGFLQYDG